jgi:L-malate glycosyltransferase
MIIFQLIQKPQLRGAEMFAAQLSTELMQLGHRVILISLFPGDSKLPFDGELITLNRPITKRWNDFEGWKQLAHLIQEHQPDVIQCNAGDTLKFAVLSKLANGWKTPLIARNASMVSAYITNPITKWINRFLYTKTKAIISVSQLSAQDINQLFPETKSKTSVIPIGINPPVLETVSWKNEIPTELNLIHVGGFSFEKNHVGLFSIFQKFLKEQPNTHLHLLGDGPLRAAMEERVNELGLHNSITFYGFTANVMNYIHQADALLLPSIIEGLPGVLLEAMYAETTVVTYNVGGISEIVFPNETGYLIEKGDEVAFVQAIGKAVHPNESGIMVKKAKELVVEKFNNGYLATQFEKIYYKLS